MAADPLDLITLARAKQAFAGALGAADATLGANESTTLQNVLTACSLSAVRQCSRNFVQTTYDEIYPRIPFPIVLKNWPIISIAFLRDSPSPVLTITQTIPTTNQYATVEVLSTGLRLQRIASGTTTTVTAGIDFAGNPTLTALATAVTALGVGWSASAVSPFGLYPSADLYVSSAPLAPIDVRNTPTNLEMHVANYAATVPHPPTGRLLIPNQSDDLPHPYPIVSLRAQYSAGYATIPEDLQDAIANWSKAVMYQIKRDPVVGNTFAAGVGSSYRPLEALMPETTRRTLSLYKTRRL